MVSGRCGGEGEEEGMVVESMQEVLGYREGYWCCKSR